MVGGPTQSHAVMTTELRSATEARVTSYEGYSLNKHWKQIEDKLAGTAVVKPARHSLAQLFTLVFRKRFVARAPAGQLRNGEYVATRSNWSYHTAISVHSAAWTLNLSCRFEVMGRLDAVIETPEEKPRVVLLAEWEWDHKDVFGKGKELDKLVKGLSASCRPWLLVHVLPRGRVPWLYPSRCRLLAVKDSQAKAFRAILAGAGLRQRALDSGFSVHANSRGLGESHSAMG
jgi:hypothetical protein